MEDQTGYAQFSRGAYYTPEETSAQWPTVMYTLRDGLSSLTVNCKLNRAATGVVRGAMAQEIVVDKQGGQPLGMALDTDNVAASFESGGVAKQQKLHVYEGWAVTHINGEPVLNPEQFYQLAQEAEEVRIRFARTQEYDNDMWTKCLAIQWQRKYPHPKELIEIMERDPADQERQLLVHFLRTEYTLPPDAELPIEADAPADLAPLFSEQDISGVFRQAQQAAPTAAAGGGVPMASVIAVLDQPAYRNLPHDSFHEFFKWLQATPEDRQAALVSYPELQALLSEVRVPEDPLLEAKLIHLLGRTVICTYTAQEQHDMRRVFLESVTTAAPEPRTSLSLQHMKGDGGPDGRAHAAETFDPVVRFDPNPPPPAARRPGGAGGGRAASTANASQADAAADEANAAGKTGQDMWIVAAFGEVRRRSGRLVWVTFKDVVLAHIEAVGRCSFKMWPPFSHLGAVVAQRRRDDDRPEYADPPAPYKFRVRHRAQGHSLDTTEYNYTVEIADTETTPAEDRTTEGGRDGSGVSDDRSLRSEESGKGEAERRLEMLNRVVQAQRRQMQAARTESDRDRPLYSGPLASLHGGSRVHFFGDIISARDFCSANLFIRFEIILPPSGWQVETSGAHNLAHMFRQEADRYVMFTQTSSMVRRKLADGCYTQFFAFAMPFELHCIAKLGQNHPRLLMEVYSERSSEQHQLEGYGHVDLATSLGSHRTTVTCWKPVPTIREHLRDFFLGCTTNHLRDPTFMSIPDGFRGSFLNKFGSHCSTTGQVEVRWNCMIQSEDPWATEMHAAEPAAAHFSQTPAIQPSLPMALSG
eukprot:TRINITY_DN9405_c0_g2_i1.p1 TRINITY_DN9405_c0_g2~~TRINITY_DN9405_c0_g2_i1.p1  ORF type:complete len:833 (+),score=301.51 TRINITY_DN9405_c0_g2_i1:62-2500(+)